MKVVCLIVDDEPLARRLIASHVAKVEGLALAGECGDALSAGVFLRTTKVDVIFLDIQMPEITGLQFIRTLKAPPAVILTTAHRDFAPEAFDLNVVDYLLKPISFERFVKAVNKILDKSQPGSPPTGSGDPCLYLKVNRKMHRVRVDEIQYVESLDDYVKVYLTNGTLVTRENITSLAQKLPPQTFIRIHRSFIVNSKFITTVSSEGVEISKTALPFGRAFKKMALASLSLRDQ